MNNKVTFPGKLDKSFESFESGEATSVMPFSTKTPATTSATQGSYYVRLPDTRLQTVKYFVDGDSGYVADVNYEGEARFPDSYESASFESASFESREYRPPRPVYTYGSNESN